MIKFAVVLSLALVVVSAAPQYHIRILQDDSQTNPNTNEMSRRTVGEDGTAIDLNIKPVPGFDEYGRPTTVIEHSGSVRYYDPATGQWHQRTYVADSQGYRVAGSDLPENLQ